MICLNDVRTKIAESDTEGAIQDLIRYYSEEKKSKIIQNKLLKLLNSFTRIKSDYRSSIISFEDYEIAISKTTDLVIHLTNPDYVHSIIQKSKITHVNSFLIVTTFFLCSLLLFGYIFPETGLKIDKPIIHQKKINFPIYKLDNNEETYTFSFYVNDTTLMKIGNLSLNDFDKNTIAFTNIGETRGVFHKFRDIQFKLKNSGKYHLQIKKRDLKKYDYSEITHVFRYEGKNIQNFNIWRQGLSLPTTQKYIFICLTILMIAILSLTFLRKNILTNS